MKNIKFAFALTAALFVLGAQASPIILDAQPESVAKEAALYLQDINMDFVEGKADERSAQDFILIRYQKNIFSGSCDITLRQGGMNLTSSNSGTSMKKPSKCVKELKRIIR